MRTLHIWTTRGGVERLMRSISPRIRSVSVMDARTVPGMVSITLRGPLNTRVPERILCRAQFALDLVAPVGQIWIARS